MVYKPTFNSSLIKKRDKESTNFTNQVFKNTSFRMGVVLEIIDVESEDNISKLGNEYNVMTVEQSGQNGQSTTIYKNCITMDGFGGVADFFQKTLRPTENPKETQRQGSLKNEVGSIVGILCLDSHSEKAVIIGSFGNPSKQVLLDKEKGHHLEGEFNGINYKIDKEGALTVTFKSPTNADGTVVDEAIGGSNVRIEKDGSFEVNNQPIVEGQDKGDTVNYEKVRLDRTKQQIQIEARKEIVVNNDKDINITSGGSINTKLKKDFLLEAEGRAALTFKKTVDVEAEGAGSIVVQQLSVESKSMIQMKASSLVQIEASSVMELKAPQVLIGPSPAEPALLGLQLITLGTGNLGAPVISNPIAGFSTSILISA